MKRLLISIVAIFSLFFLFGFAPKQKGFPPQDYIMLSLDFSSSGQIVQSVDFSVNSKRLNNITSSLKEEIEFKNALKKQIETIRNEFLFGFALTYMEMPNDEYKINKGVFLSPVDFDERADSVGFKITFSNVGAWNYYHMTLDEEKDSQKQSENVFLKKVESQGVFPFSAKVQVGENLYLSVGERYKQKYLAAANGFSFSEKIINEYKPTYFYNYSTFNQKLRSDADYTFVDAANNLHHLWSVEDLAVKEENSITLYYYSVNKGLWLVLAVILPLGSMVAAILIIKFKGKKKM